MTRQSVRAAALLIVAVPFVPLGARAAGATPGITLARQGPDQWRASNLIGLPVYGPDNRSVGTISDLLIGKDGRAEDVVVGVGGFLGIDQKDVAIPFAAVDFSFQPMPPPEANPPGQTNLGTPPAGMNPPGTVAPAAGFVAPATSPGAPARLTSEEINAVPALMRHGLAYPDHAVIAFDKTQLTSAPAFQYAK